MGLEIITGDIFECSADALVFPASTLPEICGTLDGQVYRKAEQKSLFQARRCIGELEYSTPAITESFALRIQYRYLIHIPVPKFSFSECRTYYNLGLCYINALELIKEKKLTSVVFPVLGTGASGYTYKRAKDIAVDRIESYLRRNPEINVILVEYRYHEQYKNFLNAANVANEEKAEKAAEKLETYNFLGMCNKKFLLEETDYAANRLRGRINAETDKLYLWYERDKQKFYNEMWLKKFKGIEVPEDIYQEYNDLLYMKIFNKNIKTTQAKLAERMNIDSSKITGLKNLKTKEGKVYEAARSFLRYKENVIALAMALDLNINDLCCFVWSRNHYFPTTDADYKLILDIKQKELKRKDSYKKELDR